MPRRSPQRSSQLCFSPRARVQKDASTEEHTVVSGKLEDSLRHEIESYIEGRLGGVKQEIAALQSQLNESLSRLLDRQGEVQLDGSVAASILEHLRAAHEEGLDLAASESSRAKASSDMAIVKAAISEIDEQDSQANILKILVNRAASFAPRVAFFVIKGEQSIGWRARGFEGTVGDNAIHQMSFPVAADTAVGHAARSRETWSGSSGSHSENHMILNRLGDEPPARVVAVPLVVRKRTVAVLYADSAELDSEAINLEALETLVRVSGMAVELLAARAAPAPQAATPQPAREEEAQPAEQPSYTPTAEYDEFTPVVEESAPAPQIPEMEALPEPQPAEPEREYFQPEAGPEAQPQSYVAEIEATPTPVETAAEIVAPAATTETAEAPPTPRRRYGADVELPVEVFSEEERRLHNDARRFARLLVSEIKLYNEQKVAEGRSQGDLYQRLREYIDRSREMYDKRVKPEVAQRYDYFHSELVTTLAEGDEAKLGSAYPGATVSA
jgi:outer membrane biosynthesis protein TonB